jgi:hypothetical protein
MLFYKDPDDTLDYGVNLSGWLETGEEIDSSSWAVDTGITVGVDSYAPSASATQTKIWLSGGTVGETYELTNTITTDNVPPRIIERSFRVKVVEK